MSVFQVGQPYNRVVFVLKKMSWIKFKLDAYNEIFSRYNGRLAVQHIIIFRSIMVGCHKLTYWANRLNQFQKFVQNIMPSVLAYDSNGIPQYVRKTDALVNVNVIKLNAEFYKITILIHHHRINCRPR